MAVYPFTSHAVVHAGAARVTLAGELDLDTAPLVRDAVLTCLGEQPTSLCLDLTEVSFCDCAGLGVLLRTRVSALRAGVPLVVEGLGPQPTRLLTLIGAEDIFTRRDPKDRDPKDRDAGRAPSMAAATAPFTAPSPVTAQAPSTVTASAPAPAPSAADGLRPTSPADEFPTEHAEHAGRLDAEAEATLWPPVRDLLA